jgi:hypothetical protein
MKPDQPDTGQPATGQEASPHPEYSEQALDLGGREKISITGSDMFACLHCGESFTAKVLEIHLMAHHTKQTADGYSCSECEQTFPLVDFWIDHLSMCVKSRQSEQQSSLPGVTDPSVVSDLHQGFSTPELPTNDLTRGNSTSGASDFFSLENPGTTHNKDDPNESEFGMDALNTPHGSPVPHTTTVDESQWIGHLNRIEGSEMTEVPTASANADKPGLSAALGSDECNNLDIIDQLDLLASRAAEATETLPLEESPATTGSSEHRGHITNVAESPVGMDTSRQNSIRVRTGRWNPLQDSLQEFLAFFGDRLIQETRSKRWMKRRMVQCSDKTNKLIFRHLENYAAEMMWNCCCTQHSAMVIDQESNSSLKDSWTLIDDTIELIHHCRAHILDYFCYNSIEELETAAGIADNSLEATQQQAVLRWYSSFEKFKSSQKRSRNIGDLIYNKTGTAREKIVSNGFDLVKETLFKNEAFYRLVSQLTEELRYNVGSLESTMSQIVTSEFDLPHGINTKTFRVVFNIDWEALSFMRSQYGEIVPIATVVVLTGSSTNAQATTCGEYVRQNWPIVGPEVLKIIDKSLASGSRDHIRVKSGSSTI